jgi:hypothetical protein
MADSLISLRDALITHVFARRVPALNADGPAVTPAPSTALAADLKRAADALKLAAMDEAGRQVDYARVRASDEYRRLRALTAQLRSFNPHALPTREDRLAFWINLYNALIIDAVIAFGVRRSVTETPLGILTFFWQAAYIVGGQRLSSDDIEHGVLRGNRGNPVLPIGQFRRDDPRYRWQIDSVEVRLHFALNCASASCPPVRFYDAEHLDAQLEQATRNFLTSEVHLSPDGDTLTASRIFQWYAADFGGESGVLAFIAQHTPDPVLKRHLEDTRRKLTLRYAVYDWRLNSALPPPDHVTISS